MNIIGFSARKSGGKDTCANFLVRNAEELLKRDKSLNCAYGPISYPVTIQKVAFANELKEFCMKYLGLTREQCYGTEEEKNSLTNIRWEQLPNWQELFNSSKDYSSIIRNDFMTGREVLQQVGTNWFRKMNPNIWCDLLLNKIQDLESDYFVITDIRFPNEVEAIQKQGGKVIRLTRKPFDDNHLSETALDDYQGFDFVVDNQNQALQETYNSIVKIINLIGWAKS